MELPEEEKFEDKSEDRKYFTVIPNIVVNGYSAVESGVYLYLKRKAGETGEFYESRKETCQKLDLSRPTLQKIYQQFEKDGRIQPIGTRILKTSPVKVYRITDIWKENAQNYKKRDVKNKAISPEKQKKDVKNNALRDVKNKATKKNLDIRRTNITLPKGNGEPPLKELLEKKKDFVDNFGKGRVNHEWQETALRYAKDLDIDFESEEAKREKLRERWFRLFKDFDSKKGKLISAYSFISDYPKELSSVEKTKLFFWRLFNKPEVENV